MRNRHLSSDDCKVIELSLNNGLSFKAIGKMLDKDCTTISKEVRKNYTIKKTGLSGMSFNECINRFECAEYFVCDACTRRNKTKCKLCGLCSAKCSKFEKECCTNLSKPPYVCNNCIRKFKCTLSKHLYYADSAQKSYDADLANYAPVLSSIKIKYNG